MTCRTCGADIPDGANFCPQCGARLSPTTPAQQAAAQTQPMEDLRPQDAVQPTGQTVQQEGVLWSGRLSRKKIRAGLLLLAAAWFGAVTVLLATAGTRAFSGVAGLVLLTVFAISLWFALGRLFLARLSIEYWLTGERLFRRRGIITAVTDQTELIRIDDIQVRQGLFDRLLGTGDVILISTDVSDNVLVLRGIDSPQEVAETIRQRVRDLRERKGLFVERI